MTMEFWKSYLNDKQMILFIIFLTKHLFEKMQNPQRWREFMIILEIKIQKAHHLVIA